MKKVITILLIQSFVIFHCFAQTSPTSISGSINDYKSKPIEAATISLMKAADSSVVKFSVTDKSGKFSFQNIPAGGYYISASAVGFDNFNSNVFQLNNASPEKDIDAIILRQQEKTLSTIIISAKKPLIEQKIGNVNGFPLNAQQLTLELNVNNQFSFQKGWAAELSGTYNTRSRDEGQAIAMPVGQVSAGVSKQLLKTKASLKFNVRNIFLTQKLTRSRTSRTCSQHYI